MKRSYLLSSVLIILVVIVAMSVLVAGCGGSGGTSGKTPYKIGESMELTGALSALSIDVNNGAQMAVDEINAAGGINGHPLDFIVKDNGSDASKNTAAFNELIQQDNVAGVVGPFWGVLYAPSEAICVKNKTPEIIIGPIPAENQDNIPANYWSFADAQGQLALAPGVLGVLKYDKYKNVAAVSDIQGLYVSEVNMLVAAGPKAGINIQKISDTFTPGDVDMSSQATKLAALVTQIHADAIVVATDGFTAITMIKALHKLGVNLPIIGGHAYGLQGAIDTGGADFNGVEFCSNAMIVRDQLPDSNPLKKLLIDFATKFKAKYNRDAPDWADAGYNAVELFAKALAAVGPDRAKIRDYFETKVKDYVGGQGSLTWSAGLHGHEGPGVGGFVGVKVEDGKFVLTIPDLPKYAQ